MLATATASRRACRSARSAELAEDYTETTYSQNQEGADIDSAALDADLRRRLAEMVLPEFVETEFDAGDGTSVSGLKEKR